MKKIIIISLCLLLTISSLFAYSENGQKIYDLKSDIYEAISQLYVMSGHALPSTTGPYSETELIMMLSKIERESLPEYGKQIFDYINTQFSKTPIDPENLIAVKWGIFANLELYTHTNTTSERFQTKFNWGYSVNEMMPMLNFSFETWPGKNFYGYFELPIENVTITNDVGEFGTQNIHSNILFLQNFDALNMGMISINFPYRAFGSIGGDMWSFQIGRDRLSWGAGESGNLTVGDHLRYHNMARLTTFSKVFKYTFLTSFFPHPQNYYTDGINSTLRDDTDEYNFVGGISMYMAHRLEGRFFNDKLNFTLTESIMYESKDNFLDLQVVSPTMLFHNYYFKTLANSILEFELDYTPWKYFNIYSQIAIDEFSIPGESVPGKDSSANPMAAAFMVGVKGNYPLASGILTGSLEFVKTDPYFYLRSNGYLDQETAYGLDFIVPFRHFTNAGSPDGYFHDSAIGYKYGNDAMVLNFNVGYKQYGKWEVEGNALFLWDGTYDIWTAWRKVTNGEDPTSTQPENIQGPTKEDDKHYNYKDPNAKDRNAISFMTNLTLKGSYSILDYLKVYGQLDYYNIINPGNICGKDGNNPAINDVQFTIGVGYSF